MADKSTDHPLERLVFFSDAVFAIAITLLIIEIEVPHLPHHSSWQAFGAPLDHLIPSFAGFIISFAVIGLFWASHHRAFSIACRYSPRVLPWNLAFLMMIAAMPWFTAFMSSNISSKLPTVVYCTALAVTGLLNLRVVHLATGREMADDEADGAAAGGIRLRSLGILLGAVTAIPIAALLPPSQGLLGIIGIGLWRRFLTRREKSETKSTAAPPAKIEPV